MKITFPHMGNLYIPIRSLLQNLGHDVVVPPPCSKKTLEIGLRYSPEFVCLPLKINIGNFVEAIEQGADSVLMAGGWGPCRFGYYAQLERDILHKLGYKFDLFVLESPDNRMKELIGEVKTLKTDKSWGQVIHAIKLAWEKLKASDQMEMLLEYWLPRAADKDQAEKAYHYGLQDIDSSPDRRTVRGVVDDYRAKFKNLQISEPEPLKIGLVGEVYTILEPFANYDIERSLGRMGAEVTRSIYLSHWVNDHLLGGLLKVGSSKPVLPLSAPYLNYWVGGHGRESVAYTVKFARQNFDGVIQIGPLTCMPEIVAQSIMGRVQQVEGIPVMSLYFDEHAGQAGLNTRLEAFLDMIRWRKTKAREA
ncbi:MAG: hypothetical protein ACM3MK_01130 [Chitinophagales bacterium]